MFLLAPRLQALRHLVLLGGLLLAAWPSHAARLALVIGNDSYRNLGSNGVLKNAGNDARLMAATLREAGFEVVGGVRTNLDRNGLWDALEKFKDRVGKSDEVVFFYAGHGVQIDAAQYLLPTDITAQTDDQVSRDALPLYRVQDHLRSARFALVVVDACRDNPFPPKPGQRSIGTSRGLALPAKAADGSVVVLAADKDQRALDYVPGSTSANGLFTYELVKALRTPGLDVVSAVKKTRAQVLVSARSVNHAQKPTYIDEIAEGEFVLFAGSRPQPPIQPAPPSPPPVVQAAIRPAPTTPAIETLDGHYQILADGAEVKDLETGLVWQRCSVGQSWSGSSCTGKTKAFNWDAAQALSGNGWRVPTVRELVGLRVCSKGFSSEMRDLKDGKAQVPDKCADGSDRPTIHKTVFPQTSNWAYWTSSPSVGDSGYAWFVDFYAGHFYGRLLRYDYHVRLVR